MSQRTRFAYWITQTLRYGSAELVHRYGQRGMSVPPNEVHETSNTHVRPGWRGPEQQGKGPRATGYPVLGHVSSQIRELPRVNPAEPVQFRVPLRSFGVVSLSFNISFYYSARSRGLRHRNSVRSLRYLTSPERPQGSVYGIETHTRIASPFTKQFGGPPPVGAPVIYYARRCLAGTANDPPATLNCCSGIGFTVVR